MQILITGGAGFIGSHSAEVALKAGHTVRIIDNLSTGHRHNVPDGAELIVGDVVDMGGMERAAEGCDAVLHLAALVSVPESMRDPMTTHRRNTGGTATVLEAARRKGVRRIVLASTCAVYGDLPGRKDEQSPTQLLSPYAASKLMAEQWVQVYSRAYGMESLSLRYFNVYGPRQRADSPYSGVIARWCSTIGRDDVCTVFGDGEQTRDFVSVHDVAAANLLALTGADFEWGGVYTVATGVSVSLNQVLAALEDALGQPIARRYEAPRPGDLLHSAGNSDRLQAFGWRPQVPLRDGLAELLNK